MKIKKGECGKSNNNKKTVAVSVDKYDTNMLRVGHEWNTNAARVFNEHKSDKTRTNQVSQRQC